MRSKTIVVFYMLFAAAASCSKKSAPRSPATTEPSSSSSSAVAVAWDAATPIGAWTDPPIVERLEVDCAFDPAKLSETQRKEMFGTAWGFRALECGGDGFDQSCVYDPCFEGDGRDCKRDCTIACGTCADACTGSCMACKANCQDDVCRKACAPACAKCKQDCLAGEDTCRSGKCTAVYEACREKLAKDWKANGCAATCTTYMPCRDACYDTMIATGGTATQGFDLGACLTKCKASAKPKCDMNLCGGRYGMGIEVK